MVIKKYIYLDYILYLNKKIIYNKTSNFLILNINISFL